MMDNTNICLFVCFLKFSTRINGHNWMSRDHCVYVSSQWETTLHCNVVSHWVGAFTEWSLDVYYQWQQAPSMGPMKGPTQLAEDITWIIWKKTNRRNDSFKLQEGLVGIQSKQFVSLLCESWPMNTRKDYCEDIWKHMHHQNSRMILQYFSLKQGLFFCMVWWKIYQHSYVFIKSVEEFYIQKLTHTHSQHIDGLVQDPIAKELVQSYAGVSAVLC